VLLAPLALLGRGPGRVGGVAEPRAVPAPAPCWRLAARELRGGAVWRDLGATIARRGGRRRDRDARRRHARVALGARRRVWRRVAPTVELLRAIPRSSPFPLFLLALGYGNGARIAAIVFGTTGIVLFHVAAGLARARARAPRRSSSPGCAAWTPRCTCTATRRCRRCSPESRIALAAGLVIAVVTEMLIGARYGLGARALDAQLAYRADQLWFVILLAGCAGMVLSGLVGLLERRLVRWSDSSVQE